jgi:nucleotide-binding universal stress UspA family protein
MKIMVGYDGTPATQDALALACKRAKIYPATVCVVTSLPGGGASATKEIENAEKRLNFVADDLKSKGIDCQTHLLIRGMTAGEDMVQFATDEAVDEIIIGIKRRSKVGKLLFGSNAQFVILNAPCPVTTIR